MFFFLVVKISYLSLYVFFFFNDTATTEIYTLSLHDALPIWAQSDIARPSHASAFGVDTRMCRDRKSTRLNSSHHRISYAVFCLKKKTIRRAWHNEDNIHLSRRGELSKAMTA